MPNLKSSPLLLALCLLPACGGQLVEFAKADAGRTDAVNTDARDVGAADTDAPTVDAMGADLAGDLAGTDLAGIDLGGTDLAGDLAGTDLAGIDLAGTDLAGTDLAGIDLAGTDLAGVDAGIDLPSTDLAGIDAGVDLAGIDLAGVDLAGVDLAGVDLAGVDAGVDLPNTDLAGIDLNADLGNSDAADVTPPTVMSTNPAPNAMNVPINQVLTATFSEPMDMTTINMATFILQQGVTPVVGMVNYVAATRTATFVPTTPLTLNLPYTATITMGVRDAAGNAMTISYTWSFMTSVSSCIQTAVELRSAAAFAVLAGPTVTNTGFTVVTGDLGTSPGTAVTGFGPGIVVGTQHVGNPTSALAQAELTTAYNDAAGRTLCPVAVAGNLGGQTLTPGLYKSTGSLEISSGDLVLDGQGDANAVFIFQMATTLTTTSGRQVTLRGGARSTNVFWQVGSSATLGSTSSFQGTIMADQAITMNTGAALNGRVLARIAAVNLDFNAIVRPTP